MTTPRELWEKLQTMDWELQIRRGFSGSVSPREPEDSIAIVSVGNNPNDYSVVIDVVYPKLEQIHADGLDAINADPPLDELPDFYAQMIAAFEESAPPPEGDPST